MTFLLRYQSYNSAIRIIQRYYSDGAVSGPGTLIPNIDRAVVIHGIQNMAQIVTVDQNTASNNHVFWIIVPSFQTISPMHIHPHPRTSPIAIILSRHSHPYHWPPLLQHIINVPNSMLIADFWQTWINFSNQMCMKDYNNDIGLECWKIKGIWKNKVRGEKNCLKSGDNMC